MMFERLRSPETKQKIQDGIYKALDAMKLVEKQKVPDDFLAIIEGRPWKFTYDDTHVARCDEKPELSSIVHVTRDEEGKINGGDALYGQAKVMDDMEALGFEVVHEGLAEAQENYHLFHPNGNEQASLN